MPRKPLTNPRKAATQQRSRLTVDALVEATARLLVREGYDRASTNRIAEEAGVSIGSLYQYYPSKEALVAAVIDRHNEQIMGLVHEALARVTAQSLEAAVRAIVTVAVEVHRIDPKLHRILTEQIPRTGRLKNVEAFNRETQVLVRAWLAGHAEELGVTDLDLAAFVCVTTVEALTHTAVLHRPETFAGGDIGPYVDEVTQLVVRYLR